MNNLLRFPSPISATAALAASSPPPFAATYYPLGRAVEITANSPDVLAAAEAVWGCFPRTSTEGQVALHAAVAAIPATPYAPAPPRSREHLVTIVHSPENFAVADLARGFASAWLTAAVAADRAYLRYHFLEPLVYLMLDALYFAPVHAASVALGDQAVVLCGPSGAGKTSLAYTCARRGWTYLSGDATHILRDRSDFTIAGRPHSIRFREPASLLFPELSAYAPVRRPNGKLDIEVDTRALGLDIGYQRQARHIVFLNRRPAGAARIRPFPRAKACTVFEQVLCCGDERTLAAQRSAIRRFLSLPIAELTYSHPAGAEAALRSLVLGGRT
jgi:hypothetical protein